MITTDNGKHKEPRGRFFSGITVIVAVLAVVLGGHRAAQIFFADDDSPDPIVISDWERFSSDGHRSGNPNARVTVVVFFDFLCPICQDAALALHALRLWYPMDLAVIYRHAPLADPTSLMLATAGECAGRHGRFIPFHDALMAYPDSMHIDKRLYWARQAAVTDTTSFFACLEELSEPPAIQRDALAARALGITGTPMFLVDSLLIKGYPGFERFHAIIRDAVQRSSLRAFSDDQTHGPLAWEFHEVWQVNSMKDEFLAASYLAPASVDTDASNNTYVLDRRAGTVFMISEDGNLVDSLGRAGSGPGEFCNPYALDVSDDGILTVLDLCKPGFLRWRVPEGQLMNQITTRDVIDFVGPIRVLSGDEIIVTEREEVFDDPREEEMAGWHVSRWTPSGTERMFLGALSRWHGIQVCQNYRVYPEYFQPKVRWDGRDGILAIADDSAYVVHVLVDGQESVRIERDIPVRDVVPSMVKRQVEKDGTDATLVRCNVAMDEFIEAVGYSRFVQAIADVRVGPRGEIWVLRGRIADEPSVIDVFAQTGEHVGTLPAGSPFPAAFLSSGQVIATGEDEFGATLSAFRLSRH